MSGSGLGSSGRLLYVCPYYVPVRSGAARYVGALARRFAADGWRVDVYTTDAEDAEYFWDKHKDRLPGSMDNDHGVRIHRFRVRHPPLGATGYFALRRVMVWLARAPFDPTELLLRMCLLTPRVPGLYRQMAQDRDFDLVHAVALPFDSLAYSAQRVAARHGVPFVFTPFTHLGEGKDSEVRVHYTLPHQLEISRRSQRVMAQTTIERDYLTASGVATENAIVCGPGVDPTQLAGGSRERFRQRYGIVDPIVFYVGVQAHDKGTTHLIEAMRLLWERGSSATLVLAGAQTSEFRQYLASLPSAVLDRCLLLGPISEQEKTDLLAAGDLFVMPSRTDSFGIVYLEAWLYRKPVIGAIAGGVPDVIADGKDGLLVPFGDVNQLARACERLLSDEGLARRMGGAGYEKTLSLHTWDRKYSVMRDVYEELLSVHADPRQVE